MAGVNAFSVRLLLELIEMILAILGCFTDKLVVYLFLGSMSHGPLDILVGRSIGFLNTVLDQL